MRVTVTGADSLGGMEVARRLAEAGLRVRRTTRLTRERVGREGAGERVALDFLLPDTLTRAFEGADAAVIITPEQDTMVPMTENLAAAAERTGCTRLVHISFLQASAGPASMLMEWHLEAERIVEGSSLESTCLRPNYYMQSRLLARVPPASLDTGRVSYVDIRDVAEVTARVLSEPGHAGKTYSLTGPRALSTPEVAELLGHAPGAGVGAPGLSWQHHCVEERRSSHSLLEQALCEHWIAASEDQFAAVTPDVERLTGHAPRDFQSLVLERRRQRPASRRRASSASP
jgi:uncharacterized protein YbjT (DUF2867 family)